MTLFIVQENKSTTMKTSGQFVLFCAQRIFVERAILSTIQRILLAALIKKISVLHLTLYTGH